MFFIFFAQSSFFIINGKAHISVHIETGDIHCLTCALLGFFELSRKKRGLEKYCSCLDSSTLLGNKLQNIISMSKSVFFILVTHPVVDRSGCLGKVGLKIQFEDKSLGPIWGFENKQYKNVVLFPSLLPSTMTYKNSCYL